MFQFQRIVVPLSLTESDAGLLRYASLVASLGATNEVRFVHVVTPVQEEVSPLTVGDLRQRMAAHVKEHFTGSDELTVDCQVVEGPRIDRIVEFSIEHKADLILLGHRKIRTGRRTLAQRLAMITACSVWSVPEDSLSRIDRIVAPIDFSENSADSLGVAAALAHLIGIDAVEAVHVFFDPDAIRYDERVDEIRGDEQRAFDEFLSGINTHGVHIQPAFVECNQPADEIIRRANKVGADLIVMSTRGRSQAAAILLGSVTAQVIAEAPMPVLAVKHYGAHLNIFEAIKASHFWSRPNAQTN
jgi:nucleotide-binding universal stress UspA family protein